uniref:Uncharacterized protein n=1 Tax=Plectus sambesii TaxID=2011161 RepID=A0A914XMY8_9BILA
MKRLTCSMLKGARAIFNAKNGRARLHYSARKSVGLMPEQNKIIHVKDGKWKTNAPTDVERKEKNKREMIKSQAPTIKEQVPKHSKEQFGAVTEQMDLRQQVQPGPKKVPQNKAVERMMDF